MRRKEEKNREQKRRAQTIPRVAGQNVVVRCAADQNLLHGKGDNPEEEREEETRRTKNEQKMHMSFPHPVLLSS